MVEKKVLLFYLIQQLKLLMINNIFLIKFSEIYPIGKFKYAPGTIASLFTCIIYFYLNTYFQIEILILIFFIVFFLSLLSIQNYLKLYGNKDHQSIVIDEFLGQILTLTPLLFLKNFKLDLDYFLELLIFAFLLFRFFDIVKPWPINIIDRSKSSLSVIMDDMLAGLFSAIIVFISLLWL